MDRVGPYLLGPNDENQGVYTGDARELAPAIPDESVDLIFTDPVYQNIDDYRWLAETAARVLKPNSNVLVFCGNPHEIEAGAAMLPFLIPRPKLSAFMCPPYPRLFDTMCHVNVSPLLWLSKGNGQPKRWITLQYSSSYHYKSSNHDWGKNLAVCYHWINYFADSNEMVFDPFTGGGTVPAVCKMLGRRWLAFEIDPATADVARERIRNTQPPLFTLEPRQAEMEWGI